ncbi:MAG: DUF5312 family protein [Treponema sp.]|jgi:hypothetical protein|nr:DUF5312 family protein [Treponema sp.]
MPDENILNKVISFISGGESSDDSQLLLKQVVKEIQQNKYAKFYRPRQEEADDLLAQYFYSIYKAIYSGKNLFKQPDMQEKIKHIALESYLDKDVMDIIRRLTPEAISERKLTAGANLPVDLEKDLEKLTADFDSPKLAEADKIYNLLSSFNRFVTYDYYSLLKKFDPDLQEGFSIPPKFSSIRADNIMADLAAFLSIVPSFDQESDWKTVLEILKYCNGGTPVISYEAWISLLKSLKDMMQSKILELIVKLASGNPIFEVKRKMFQGERLTADWLAEKTAQVRQVIMGITENQRHARIVSLERELFGSTDISRLEFYSKEKGKILSQKGVDTYIYAPALNHLAAFVEYFITKEMTEITDILLVRGQWVRNNTSIVMSEAYHSVIDILNDIKELDESLSNEGSNGPRLRGALLRVDRDASQTRYLNNIVDSLNVEALNIINRIIPSLIVVGKHLKMLLDDCQRKSYEHIMNWKELGLLTKIPMHQRLGDDYKKINYFVQLMLLETRQNEPEE